MMAQKTSITMQNLVEIARRTILRYWQDLFAITHNKLIVTRENTSLAINVVQKITIICAQMIRKFAV